jgi:single-strand DNA-binding protein
MPSYNRVILMGNLTRDPEVRTTPQGTSICKFGIAVSRQSKSADGTAKEEVVFLDVDSFGKQAEIIGKYFSRGRPILVEGRLRMDQWETQGGEKRSKLCVVLENFQFVGSRADEDAGDFRQPGHGDQSQSRGVPIEDLSKGRTKGEKRANLEASIDEDVPF